MKRAFPVIACGALLVVASAACDRNRENTTLRPSETTTTGGETKGTQVPSGGVTTVSAANAVDKITIARCDREASCNNIGVDKKFASADACSRDLRLKVRDDLKASDCPAGLDVKELDECLNEIRKEDCGNPFDTIARLTACRSAELCVKGR